MEETKKDLNKVLEQTHGMVRRDHYDQAAELLGKVVEEIQNDEEYQDGEDYELHRFREPFEDVLYREIYNPTKELRQVEQPVGEVYLQYANALFELERYDEAKAAIQEAIRWNPTYVKNYFELMEIVKQEGDLEKFFEMTVNAFGIAFIPQDIARCYRNLAYYFLEKQSYDEALNCVVMSMNFDPNAKQGEQLLYFISEVGGRNVPQPSFESLQRYGEQYGFPVGAAPEVVTLAFSYGKRYEAMDNKDGMRYFYGILYNLTGDEEIKAVLDKLDQGPRIIMS